MNENTNHEDMVECHYKGTIIHIPAQMFVSLTMRMPYQSRKYIRYNDGPDMYGVSMSTFRRLAKDSGALYHPSNGVALINVEKFDEYMEFFRDPD